MEVPSIISTTITPETMVMSMLTSSCCSLIDTLLNTFFIQLLLFFSFPFFLSLLSYAPFISFLLFSFCSPSYFGQRGDGRPEAVLHGCSTIRLATTDNRLLKGMTILKPLVSCFFCIMVATSLLLAQAAATAISSSIPGVVEMARDVQTLRQLAKNHGKFFGSCENINVLNNGSASPEYQKIINTQFSLVTAENSCKFTETEYTQNSFQFTDCDTIFSRTLPTLTRSCADTTWCGGN